METRYWKNQAANRQVDRNSNVQKIKRDIVSQYINPKLISMWVLQHMTYFSLFTTLMSVNGLIYFSLIVFTLPLTLSKID